MSDMKLSATYRVLEVHKKTTAKLFKDLEVGSSFLVELIVEEAEHTYGVVPYFNIILPDQTRYISYNELRRVLLNFSLKEV